MKKIIDAIKAAQAKSAATKAAKKKPPPVPPLPAPPTAALPVMASIEVIEKPAKITIANGFFSYGNVVVQNRNIISFSMTSTSISVDNKRPAGPWLLRNMSLFLLAYLYISTAVWTDLPSHKSLPVPPLDWIPGLTMSEPTYHLILLVVLIGACLALLWIALKKIKLFAPKRTISRFFFEVELSTPKRLIFACPSKEFAEDFLKKIQAGIDHGRRKITADFNSKKVDVETIP